jgi:hypothetical protein
MTGLLLLFVGMIWLVLASWLATLVAKRLPAKWWRISVRVLLFLTLLPLPLLDEIVGKAQFERLCKENATVQVNRATARGRTVYLANLPDVPIRGTWVRVVLQPRRFVDAMTGETVVSYNGLVAAGGRLVQVLGISEGGVPLTFKGWCKPGDQHTLGNLFKELDITLVRRSSRHDEVTK